MKNEHYWIDHLQLQKHPEGGYFKETYRSSDKVMNRNEEIRSALTSIYFLITSNMFSAFHKIESDEIFNFYEGSVLTIYVIKSSGELELLKIGRDIENGEQLQGVVKAGAWFASKVDLQNTFSLVGCTVSPGFDFNDFELANRSELIELFPQHIDIIKELTRL